MTYAFHAFRGFGADPPINWSQLSDLWGDIAKFGIDGTSGLRMAAPQVAGALVTTLGSGTTFSPSSSTTDPSGGVSQIGQAFILLPPNLSANWVNDQVAHGNAVLARPGPAAGSSVNAGPLADIVITNGAAAIAMGAGVASQPVGGAYVVVAAPPALLAQAQQLASPGNTVPPFVPGVLDQPAQPGAPTQASSLPKWALPVGIGAGALVLVLLLAGKKRAAPVHANPFRRNKGRPIWKPAGPPTGGRGTASPVAHLWKKKKKR